MINRFQRPSERELLIDAVSNRLWESGAEQIAQVLQQLNDPAIRDIAKALSQMEEERRS